MKDDLYLIKSRKGLGVVQQSQNGTKCLTCNARVVRCKHLDIYFNSHGEKEKQSNQNRSYQQRCYSLARIPFSSNFAMQETYKKALTDRFLFEYDVVLLKPEAEICDDCGINLTEMEDKIRANIFVMNKILKANGKTFITRLLMYVLMVVLHVFIASRHLEGGITINMLNPSHQSACDSVSYFISTIFL